MENFTINSSVESLASEAGQQFSGPLEIRNSLMKRFGMNNVTQVNYDDISVIREGSFYYVDVDYEVRVPFIKNVDLLVSFTNRAQVSAQ